MWALYLRAMLLWHSCLSLRTDTSISEADKADFAIRAWLETEAIEEALNKHVCGVERSSMYSGREYLFKCAFYPQAFVLEMISDADIDE